MDGATRSREKNNLLLILESVKHVNDGEEMPVAAGKLEPTTLFVVFSVMYTICERSKLDAYMS